MNFFSNLSLQPKAISLFVVTIALFILPGLAHASERMMDRSLSVEDSFREPNIRYTPQGDTGFAPNVPIDANTAKQLQDLKAAEGKDSGNLPPFLRKGGDKNLDNRNPGQSSMKQFCASTSSCRESQRQQACERFKNAAVNVQQLMDRVVYCELNSDNGMDADCDGLDAGRVDLLKQYWQDEDMSYTILFLPDMVANASASCSSRKGMGK